MMDRPPLHSNQAAPARRRIVPTAVTQDEHANACNNKDFSQPLVVAPPPATGNSKGISECGPGRRVFVNIDSKIEVKWRDVLRQQGLDISIWRKQRDQQLAKHEPVTGAQGAAKRRDVTGLLAKKHQQLYEESDGSAVESDEEDEGESGEGDDGEGEEGDGAGSSGEHEEEEDDAEDDDEEEKEGNETGGEVDLEKEAEAEQQQAKAKRKRPRFERYDDDFIDDSELETVKVAAQAKTKFSGFYVTQGGVETIEEAPKPRAKPKPRQPKTADTAATAGAAAPAGSGPGRKRKQPAQHDQQDNQQLGTSGEAAPKKKRQRSETPASALAAAAQDTKPAAGKKAKPSPVPPATDAAQPAAAGNGAGPGSNAAAEAAAAAGLPPAPPAAAAATGGGKSTAQMAIAAAMAAKNKKVAPSAGSHGDSAGNAAAAAQPPQPPAAAAAAAEAAIAKETLQKAAQGASTQQQQHGAVPAQQSVGKSAAEQDGTAASAAAALAAAAPTPTKTTPAAAVSVEAVVAREAASKADTANRDAAETAAAGGTVVAAKAAGLPADVVAAVEALQKAVAEHKPAAPGTSSSAASMSKAVRTVLDAVGVTFARQPQQVREECAPVLVSVLAPLMLPYMKEKKLRRLVLEEPMRKAEELDSTKAALMAELKQVAGQKEAAGAAADGANDDFQAQLSTAAADALVAAWTAAKDVPDVLHQLALDVCCKLGWSQVQDSPSKAVAELLPVVKKAKKRLSKHKQHSQPTSGRQSPEPAEAAAAAVDEAAAAAAAGDAVGCAPGPTPKKRGGSSNLDNHPTAQHLMATSVPLAAAAAGGGSSAAAAAPAASQKQSQKHDKEKEHWSQFNAPSPRLQRCVEAAVAAGAERQWLSDKYATLKGSYMHQAFRTLCMSGPKGCIVPEFVARAAEHNLGFSNEDNKTVRRAVKQSLQTITMTNIVGVTEADPKAFALLCFSGVTQQPAKTSKAAADTSGPQQGTQAAAE